MVTEDDLRPASGFETRVMARALAGLFAAGAVLALLTVILPHSAEMDEAGVLAVVVAAWVAAGVMFWRAPYMSARILPYGLALGSTAVTLGAYFSGEAPSPAAFFYLWVFLYAAYFFTRRETAVQVVYVAVAYAVLLLVRPPPAGGATWWVVGIGSLLVAAVLVLAMRARVETLIARLFDAARTDPLTRLLNRRGFRELLDLELERSRRSETPMTVVVADLDHFKDVNDRAGHQVGDAYLRRVAEVFEAGKRQIDTVARVGGEEFALILPGTESEGAFVLAERLRTDIRDAFLADLVPLTTSFGVATYPQHGETAGALLRSADEALYGAKESGRNRTVIHSPELHRILRDDGSRRDIEGERYLAVILDLAEAVDLRLSGSARHCETVGRYAEMMARELRLPERQVGRIRLAGILHDVGKVAVPDGILRKPSALDPEEWEVMRRHPELGAQILEHESLSDVRAWVAMHHERPDGLGYPKGVAGDELPLEARILAVADAYEAMTSDRPYRHSLGHEAARAELQRLAGSQFDAAVVQAFLAVLAREAARAATA